jgi:hypothetical protein
MNMSLVVIFVFSGCHRPPLDSGGYVSVFVAAPVTAWSLPAHVHRLTAAATSSGFSLHPSAYFFQAAL